MRKKLELENCYWDYNEKILGLDEAGRGAIAGPIVVAGVMFPKNFNSCLIQDSKKLSHSQRLKSLEIIKKNAIEYRFVFKDSQCVDLLNPLIATKQAMVEIIKEFRNVPDICLVDGREELKVGNFRTISVISGDSKSVSIAAASIVAKVVRDEFMKKIHENYPEYNWKGNKGYPNKEHIKFLFKNGPCSFHRKTYEPVKSLLNSSEDKRKELVKKYKIFL